MALVRDPAVPRTAASAVSGAPEQLDALVVVLVRAFERVALPASRLPTFLQWLLTRYFAWWWNSFTRSMRGVKSSVVAPGRVVYATASSSDWNSTFQSRYC